MASGYKTDRKEWLFKQAKCSAFMKKVNDGRCIMHYSAGESCDGKEHWTYYDSNNPDFEHDVPEDEYGYSDFIKTYYERREKKFVGMVVGFDKLTAKAELFVDTAYQYDGAEYEYVGKHPIEQIEVARVFYACNKSRYVPIDDMVILRKGAEDGEPESVS